ncbi:MAG TPA: AAA family ATPase [Thiobacillaceae bacterium]|nr:AAA family ATPase [Thiobacillaceae bacterium]HNU63030.1 AAA family ATPase [Thiobacillaceae bacterium]
MNAEARPAWLEEAEVSLAERLFATLAPAADHLEPAAGPEARWLAALAAELGRYDLAASLAEWRARTPPADARLALLTRSLGLSDVELAAVALALAADTDVAAARALAWLQGAGHDAHPTLGLLASLLELQGQQARHALTDLLDGMALASGLLRLEAGDRPLPDARLRLPQALAVALTGGEGRWPGIRLGDTEPLAVPDSLRAEAAVQASRAHPILAIRSGHPLEARAACAAIANALGRRPVFIEGEPPAGLGPWLVLHDAIPVAQGVLGPGERREAPRLPGHSGPLLLASGPEGSWERDGEMVPSWHVPMPNAAERIDLWRLHGADADAAVALGRTHRHASARIAGLAREANQAGRVDVATVARVARGTGQSALGSLASLVPDDIPDQALVLPPTLRRELEDLAARCRARDHLDDGLGPAARARYRPGVRALLVGPSGTGKTLASGWLACRLGLPLYRVDMAAVSSKYIGETEKNLGELFARAEHAEVVLLFDEADALFGKRTDVKDAHDRYANQQTNYLLQRIEAFDGIVLLTSNSRARFDSAFSRRLDTILEFPMPGAGERRALWLAHLGAAHDFDDAALNRLAASSDLAGGHIRNVVLAARAMAPAEAIAWPALRQALAAEYRKLGKTLPAGLAGSA